MSRTIRRYVLAVWSEGQIPTRLGVESPVRGSELIDFIAELECIGKGIPDTFR